MAWQDEMTIILRAMVNDLTSTTYDDDTLQQVLAIAAFQVSNEMTFSQAFKGDAVNVGITPDPTIDLSAKGGVNTRDESFMNLTCEKAACIIDRGAAATSAAQAIFVKDGSSAIDLREAAKAKMNLLMKGGWCAVYDQDKLEYKSGQVRIAGAAVMGPFRIYAQGGGGMGYYVTVPNRERNGI